MNNLKGFTLIELMVVVSIIGILASISLPSYQNYIRRAETVEALSLVTTIREEVTQYYQERLAFPENNKAAGVPEPEFLIGLKVSKIEVQQGAIHVTLGHGASKPLHGKILTFRPATVIGSPTSPISWLCGYTQPVKGMQPIGENKTNIDMPYLPSACRG